MIMKYIYLEANIVNLWQIETGLRTFLICLFTIQSPADIWKWFRERYMIQNFRPSWYLGYLMIIKQFLTFYPAFHTQKHFSRKFCLSMVIRTWNMEIPTFDLSYIFS